MATVKKVKEGLLISWVIIQSPSTVIVGHVDLNIPHFNYRCNLIFDTRSDNWQKTLIPFQRPVVNFGTVAPVKMDYVLKLEMVNRETSEPVYPVEIKVILAKKDGGQQKEVKQCKEYFNDPNKASLIWKAEFENSSSGSAHFDILIQMDHYWMNLTMTRKRLENVRQVVNLLRENPALNEDVVIFNCENQTIKGHPSVLAAYSPVFSAMFEHDFKEKKEKIVEITDIKSNVLFQLVQYIYMQEVDLENVDVAGLFAAADKYGIDTLKEECASYLFKTLTLENATRYFALAYLHKAPELYESSLDFIVANAKAICSRESDWMEMVRNYPELSYQITKRIISIS